MYAHFQCTSFQACTYLCLLRLEDLERLENAWRAIRIKWIRSPSENEKQLSNFWELQILPMSGAEKKIFYIYMRLEYKYFQIHKPQFCVLLYFCTEDTNSTTSSLKHVNLQNWTGILYFLMMCTLRTWAGWLSFAHIYMISLDGASLCRRAAMLKKQHKTFLMWRSRIFRKGPR